MHASCLHGAMLRYRGVKKTCISWQSSLHLGSSLLVDTTVGAWLPVNMSDMEMSGMKKNAWLLSTNLWFWIAVDLGARQ